MVRHLVLGRTAVQRTIFAAIFAKKRTFGYICVTFPAISEAIWTVTDAGKLPTDGSTLPNMRRARLELKLTHIHANPERNTAKSTLF